MRPPPPEPSSGNSLPNLGPCPELLAPAGDWDCARAAVENGADAIYFGVEKFNARMRAHNFTLADLPELMSFLHRRGVKGYVTFNILVFTDELAEAERDLRTIIRSGVDAAIVQDVGICRLIRRLSPDFPIHASTQMTISSAAGLEFARGLGCSMVALARECSIPEISRMRTQQLEQIRQTESGGEAFTLQTPLEVFVHGALCVAYSGQCLTSESLGGRSANRGVCAQACRLPCELLSDGQVVPLGDKRYLLSPRDLAGLDALPELGLAGVSTLKIEGRLKRPEYVASITRIYREALDRLWGRNPATGQPGDETGPGKAKPDPGGLARQIATRSRYELEMAFSRGLYTGWLRGVNNQELVHARFGKKRGVFLGEVVQVQQGKAAVVLKAPLKPGDGVVFDAGQPDLPEQGGRVYAVEALGGYSWLSFGWGDLDFERVHTGDKLWKTNDPELDRRLRQTYTTGTPGYRRPLDLLVEGAAGMPLVLTARDERGRELKVHSSPMLAEARKQPLTQDRLAEQLGRLGGTPFRLGRLDNRLHGDVIIPVSELNQMRREMVQQFESLWAQPPGWACLSQPEDRPVGPELSGGGETSPAVGQPCSGEVELVVLVRSRAQLTAALKCGASRIYCELENLKHYRDAVREVRDFGNCERKPPEIWAVPPRIAKPDEEWMLQQVRASGADGYLVRNYDHLQFFRADRKVGDFSLNVANPISARYFVEKFGLERVTAAYDLNADQLASLLGAAPPAWFEITIHQYMPMFHMEHCVFCSFLSQGTDHTNCGRPCEKHAVRLRDRVGVEHPVKADAGCRNTVFNGRAQSGAEHVQRLMALGARSLRVEFLDETPAQVADTLARYRQLLRGEISGSQLWRELKLINYLGVTRGPMDPPFRSASTAER